MNWEELTSAERLVAEQAILNLRSLNMTCRMAADGQVRLLPEGRLDRVRDLLLVAAHRLAVDQLLAEGDGVGGEVEVHGGSLSSGGFPGVPGKPEHFG